MEIGDWAGEEINTGEIINKEGLRDYIAVLGMLYGTNVANPIDKDDIIGHAKQIQLTNIEAGGAPSQRQGAPLPSKSN